MAAFLTPGARACKERVIALTGGIASGKSAVAGVLREAGYPVFAADDYGRAVVAPGSSGLRQLVACFGPQLISASGQLQRQQLRHLVLSSSRARKQAEAILHPLVWECLGRDLAAWAARCPTGIAFYESALVFETNSAARFREVWCCVCPAELQRQRLEQRPGVDAGTATRWLESQIDPRCKAEQADYVIDTTKTLKIIATEIRDRLGAEDLSPSRAS